MGYPGQGRGCAELGSCNHGCSLSPANLALVWFPFPSSTYFFFPSLFSLFPLLWRQISSLPAFRFPTLHRSKTDHRVPAGLSFNCPGGVNGWSRVLRYPNHPSPAAAPQRPWQIPPSSSQPLQAVFPEQDRGGTSCPREAAVQSRGTEPSPSAAPSPWRRAGWLLEAAGAGRVSAPSVCDSGCQQALCWMARSGAEGQRSPPSCLDPGGGQCLLPCPPLAVAFGNLLPPVPNA